ncbi:MAG: hypothetical protein KA401_05125, partial [Anaerolineae bacterium]|nr:hypothetical protein [Anaerolineae bacterium]
FSLLFTVSGWALMFTMAGIGVYLAMAQSPLELWVIWALNIAIFIVKHRTDLTKPIAFRGPLARLSKS